MPLASAALIVRNEEPLLPGCLESLRGLVDELVVVDTGSTDRTREVAARFGARLLEIPWRDDFAAARTVALGAAPGDWILVIDADERVVSTDDDRVRTRLVMPNPPNLLLVEMALPFPDGRVEQALLPRWIRRQSGIRFRFPVHEQVDVCDETAADSQVRLRHVGYMDQQSVLRKEARNLAIAEAMEPGPHAWHCIARAAFSLGQWDRVVTAGRAVGERAGQPGPAVRETAVLAAAAAFNQRDLTSMAEFVLTSSANEPDHPDVRYAEAVLATARYVAAGGNALLKLVNVACENVK